MWTILIRQCRSILSRYPKHVQLSYTHTYKQRTTHDTEYAQVQLNGTNLSDPSKSKGGSMNPDDVPSSLLDYAIQFAASQLKEKIKPQMRVSAFEDNFHTIFESFCKKQARRSRINWKKRYLRLRCRTLCVSLSHFIQHTHTHTHTHQTQTDRHSFCRTTRRTRQHRTTRVRFLCLWV